MSGFDLRDLPASSARPVRRRANVRPLRDEDIDIGPAQIIPEAPESLRDPNPVPLMDLEDAPDEEDIDTAPANVQDSQRRQAAPPSPPETPDEDIDQSPSMFERTVGPFFPGGASGLHEARAIGREFVRDPAHATLGVLTGVSQGATMGAGDEIAAGLGALADTAGDYANNRPTDIESRYDERHRAIQEGMDEAMREAPRTTRAADLASSVPLTLGGPGIGPRAAGLGSSVVRGALTGAGYAGAEGFLRSNAPTLRERAEEAVTPAVVGGALGGATGLVIPAIGRIRGAVAGMEANQLERRALASRRPRGRGASNDISDEMLDLDEGATTNVPAEPSREEIYRRATDAMERERSPERIAERQARVEANRSRMANDEYQQAIEAARAQRAASPAEDATGRVPLRPRPRPASIEEPLTPTTEQARPPMPERSEAPQTESIDELLAPVQRGQVRGDTGVPQTLGQVMSEAFRHDPVVGRMQAVGAVTIPQMQRIMAMPGGIDRASEIMHETGILGHGDLDTVENVLARTEAVRDRAGQAVRDIEAQMSGMNVSVPSSEIAGNLRVQARQFGELPDPRSREAAAYLDDIADRIEARGDMPVRDALRIMRGFDQNARWDRAAQGVAPASVDMARVARREMRNAINQSIEQAAPEMASRYDRARELYQVTSTLAPAEHVRQRMAQAHRVASLTDYAGGAAGAQLGGMVAGAPGAVAGAAMGVAAHRLYRRMEGSIWARVFGGKAVPPEILNESIRQLQRQAIEQPQAFGRYANVAARAAGMGTAEFAAWARRAAQTPDGARALDEATGAVHDPYEEDLSAGGNGEFADPYEEDLSQEQR